MRDTSHEKTLPSRCVFAALALACAVLLCGCAAQMTPAVRDGHTVEAVPLVSRETFDEEPTDTAQTSSQAGASSEAASAQPEPAPVFEQPDSEALFALLDEESAAILIERASYDADASWIAAHPGAYEQYGIDEQVKLLNLASYDALSQPFVRAYPEHFPTEGPDWSQPAQIATSPSPDVPETAIPHLYQWDQRWGYVPYSAGSIGTSGCGPTALAMVYQGLTGDQAVTPYETAQLAGQFEYVDYELGTMNSYFTDVGSYLGLQCWEMEPSVEGLVEALAEGHPIIANVGVGTFSDVGHFFVLTGLSEDGRVILNDPYSRTRSSQLWEIDHIVSESLAFYVYG